MLLLGRKGREKEKERFLFLLPVKRGRKRCKEKRGSRMDEKGDGEERGSTTDKRIGNGEGVECAYLS